MRLFFAKSELVLRMTEQASKPSLFASGGLQFTHYLPLGFTIQ
jgi:hypothetical protein